MNTLGSRLLELRKQKGFTQEQLAEKLHVTNQSVSKWEKDIKAPDITLLVELAHKRRVRKRESARRH